jgi:hypothetical protein
MAWQESRRGFAADTPSWKGSASGAVKSRALHCGLLDVDPELAEALGPEARRVARAAATSLTLESDAGELQLAEWLEKVCGGPGLLVLDGVLAISLRVGDRVAAELVGAGDLLQPPPPPEDELITSTVSWRALLPMRFAVLDEGFANRTRFWPAIATALLRRGARRNRHLSTQRAIAAQPRLEVRLALLLWHLAARWGRVEPGGIRLPIPLTHQLLGRLVSAERPSVSHALARLSHAGLVTGHGNEWHLHGSLDRHVTSMLEYGYSGLDGPAALALASRHA